MTESQFLRHVGAYGADPARWPPELRAGAERALAASPALRDALREAEAFDRLLAGTPPAVEEARVARLLGTVAAAARATPQETLMVLLLGRMPRRMAATLCVALVALGWLAGTLAAPNGPARATTHDVALLSEDVLTLFDGESR